ncbi:MAG: hypothetical protein M3Q48_10275 [Actinomycetota bacterium]|nr:hypothetical protein [Actinomycetota bacterium]
MAAYSGDGPAAEARFEDAFTEAQAKGDKVALADALFGMASLACAGGEGDRAASLHHEALALRAKMGEAPAVTASLEAVAGLAVTAGRLEHAARLLGAAERARAEQGYARAAGEAGAYESHVALLGQGLPLAELEAARAQGAQLSLEEGGGARLQGPRPSRPAW